MWGITDRRHFLKHAAAFGAFSLTADNFLSALRAQAPALKKKNKSLIIIHFGGGYPAIDFWEDKDPHPNMGETRSASTAVSGIKINRLLPKTGSQMKNVKLLLHHHGAPLAKVPVQDITPDMIQAVLEKLWSRTPLQGRRTLTAWERVLDYAKAKGWRHE